MGIFEQSLWGVRFLIWLYLLMAVLLLAIVILYRNRQIIQEKYWKIRWPERVVMVRMIYQGNMFKIIWRLIPDSGIFVIDGKRYLYDEDDLIRENDSYIYGRGERLFLKVDGVEYDFMPNRTLSKKGRRYPEIDYHFNNPKPIDHTLLEQVQMTAESYQKLHENDLMMKFLRLEMERTMMMFLMIIGIVNLLIGFVIISKLMGWIK